MSYASPSLTFTQHGDTKHIALEHSDSESDPFFLGIIYDPQAGSFCLFASTGTKELQIGTVRRSETDGTLQLFCDE